MNNSTTSRLGVLLGTPLAVLVAIHGFTWAGTSIKTWQTGETLTANDLNANLTALNTAMVDTTTDQTIAGNKTFSGNVNVGYTQVAAGVNDLVAVNGTATPGKCKRFGTLNTASGYVDCVCPTGMVVLSGGAYSGDTGISESRPAAADTWRFKCMNGAAFQECAGFHIVCARFAP